MKKVSITSKFFIWIVACIMSIFPALLVNDIFGYLPFMTLFLTGIVSLIWLKVITGNITYESSNSGYEASQNSTAGESGNARVNESANESGTGIASQNICVRGDSLDFGVVIENKSRFIAPRIEIQFQVKGSNDNEFRNQEAVLSLKGRERRRFGYGVSFNHIGVYHLQINKVTIYDLLGIWKYSYSHDDEYKTSVYPAIHHISKLPINDNPVTESMMANVQSPQSGMDYTGVREYAYGDTIKSIHWKLSAHLNGMVTKKTETYTNTGVSVVVDRRIPDYDQEMRLYLFDAIAETAISAGDFVVKHGMDCDLMYITLHSEKKRIIPQSFHKLTNVLNDWLIVEDDTKSYHDIESLLKEECGSIYNHANVVICTACISENMMSTIIQLKNAGKTPLIFAVIPENIYDRNRDALLRPLRMIESHRIPYIIINAGETTDEKRLLDRKKQQQRPDSVDAGNEVSR